MPIVAAYNRVREMKGKGCSPEKSEYAAWTSCKISNVLKNEVYMETYVGQKNKRIVTGVKKGVKVDDGGLPG